AMEARMLIRLATGVVAIRRIRPWRTTSRGRFSPHIPELVSMDLMLADYNGADTLFHGPLAAAWSDVRATLEAVPLHLKPSDQASKVGAPIWDPVGMNSAIKDLLLQLKWAANVPV